MKCLIFLLLLVACATDVVNPEVNVTENHTETSHPTETIVEVVESNINCNGPVGLDCEASFTDGILTMDWVNNLGYDMHIDTLTHYEDEEPWTGITHCETNQEAALDIQDGGKFRLVVDCSGFDRLDQGFEIEYNGILGYIRIKN